MAKLKLSGKELRAIGYPEGPVISIAMNVMEQHFKHLSKEDALEILRSIIQSPNQYAHDGILGKIAAALLPKPSGPGDEIRLKTEGVPFQVFGAAGIEQGALHQMHTAAKIPVAVAGALMPDAHHWALQVRAITLWSLAWWKLAMKIWIMVWVHWVLRRGNIWGYYHIRVPVDWAQPLPTIILRLRRKNGAYLAKHKT